MAIPHARAGEVVDVRPLGSALASAQTKTLVRAEQVEVIRLIVPAGKEIEEHKAKGEIVVQCLEGRVAFTVFRKTQNSRSRAPTLSAHGGTPLSQRDRERFAPADDPHAQMMKSSAWPRSFVGGTRHLSATEYGAWAQAARRSEE